MAKNLVIVESPAKAKTIEGFLGKDYLVKSCYGHIRDLGKSDLSIELENNYKPRYEITPDKKQVIAELSKLAKESDTVWLASDEDREGEAISWHLFEALKLDSSHTKRIVFHEITKPAILRAIESPRQIDLNLVNAQQARRILDRLVGYELSPVLWKKVKPSLSAGRVQSVAVRLLVDREREIQQFKTESYFRVSALLNGSHQEKKYVLKAQHPGKLKNQAEAEDFLKSCKGALFSVKGVEKKPAKRTPSAPFTTSTLQQEASRKLGFSVSQTMVIAQRLYEAGKITYMRTDSVNLSETAIDAARNQITEQFGKNYHKERKFTTKTKGAQEAHEAIRPTYMNDLSAGSDNQEKRLYDLIWKRTIASQMADAELEKTIISIEISGSDKTLEAQGEVVVFDGFLKVYSESSDDQDEEGSDGGLLPPVNKGDTLELQEMNALQKFSNSPPRYTEASLVKKLEELGIGRPSTYAPTISTIQKRNYVIKEDREGTVREFIQLTLKNGEISTEKKKETTGVEKNKLFPTDIGTVVNDFLLEHFSQILDFNFTAKVEKQFDEIAIGEKEWTEMIDLFYKPFHANVQKTEGEAERATGARLLGTDPGSGKPVYVRIGRYGALSQIGENDDPEKRFANLRSGMRLETIKLEEALELFKLPRNLGLLEEKEMVVGTGRFGPYIRHNNKFYSLPKTDDPHTVDSERAVEIIFAKRKADAEKIILRFEGDPEILVQNGRFGPYISKGKENFKIPKGTNPETLTKEDCLKIIESGETKAKPSFRKKKK